MPSFVSPPGAATAICGPRFEYEANSPARVVADTPIASGHAPGYFTAPASLPAAATTTTPDATTWRTSSHTSTEVACNDRLMTFAPWSAAHAMPAIMLASVALPVVSVARTGKTDTPGATPAMPTP